MTPSEITHVLEQQLFTFNAVVDGARDAGFIVAVAVTPDGLAALYIEEPSGRTYQLRPVRK